jgi:hypothetical protein
LIASFEEFKHFDQEHYIVRRLHEHGADIYSGVTDPEIRKARIRAAIVNNRLEYAVVGKNLAGKTETWADLFKRVFNEQL